MRFILALALISAIVIAGCMGAPQAPPEQKPPAQPAKTCRNVTEQVPFVEEECGPFSFTENVCGLRNLNYSIERVPKADLCTADGPCAGYPLSECQTCSKAMTRCVLIIKNEETLKSGEWSVGANYSLGNAGFVKDPITRTIAPGQSAAFDFDQIYTVPKPISSASCEVFVVSEPTIEDCHEETRSRTECTNVTRYNTVTREVCE
ncbi:MAG: hypothetical protein AB1324_06510 [Candidatus Micrarchaeota archaeon]